MDKPTPVLAFLHSKSLCALIFIHCLLCLIHNKAIVMILEMLRSYVAISKEDEMTSL